MLQNKYLVVIPGIILAFVLYTLSQGFNNVIGIEFFEYENNKKPPYYLEDKYKKINLPLRIVYSLIIYGIVLVGFFKSKKEIKFEHYILLTFSSLYMLGMLGWVGNSRYMAPILIYLSIFFGHGLAKIIGNKN